ncbi:MAG: aminomethyltransferase family protein [Gemmatimonadales bacterium]
MLKTTPFHPRTAPLVQAQAWRRWAGYAVASAYLPSHEPEYAAIRSSAALIDISPLHKYRIGGPDAVRLLDRLVTRDVTRCEVGQVMYTPWCDDRGKVIDDGTVSRLGEAEFRLTSAEPNYRWLWLNQAGLRVRIEDESERTAALALQGPLSRAILQEVTADDLGAIRFFRLLSTRIGDIPVTVSRTGYTGDLGYELWVDAARAVALWDALVAAGSRYGLNPAGIWALDVSRIEAGLLMLDVDYHSAHRAAIPEQESSPFELSLAWTVSANKGPYNGRRAHRAERARGPSWRLVGLTAEWDSLETLYRRVDLPPQLPTVAWRTSVPVYQGREGVRVRQSRQIGYATSGVWSPLLKQYLALAHLESGFATPGTPAELEVTVEHHRHCAAARVVKLPFFDPPRKRA